MPTFAPHVEPFVEVAAVKTMLVPVGVLVSQ
jgi:hypothetical protein